MTDVKQDTLPCRLHTKQGVFPATVLTFRASALQLSPPLTQYPLSSTSLLMGKCSSLPSYDGG